MCSKYPCSCVIPEWYFVFTCCSANASVSALAQEKGKILIFVLMLLCLLLCLCLHQDPFHVACITGVSRGGGSGGGREFGQKNRKVREGGGGKRTPAIKTPIGSFLRLLAAAKF